MRPVFVDVPAPPAGPDGTTRGGKLLDNRRSPYPGHRARRPRNSSAARQRGRGPRSGGSSVAKFRCLLRPRTPVVTSTANSTIFPRSPKKARGRSSRSFLIRTRPARRVAYFRACARAPQLDRTISRGPKRAGRLPVNSSEEDFTWTNHWRESVAVRKPGASRRGGRARGIANCRWGAEGRDRYMSTGTFTEGEGRCAPCRGHHRQHRRSG